MKPDAKTEPITRAQAVALLLQVRMQLGQAPLGDAGEEEREEDGGEGES